MTSLPGGRTRVLLICAAVVAVAVIAAVLTVLVGGDDDDKDTADGAGGSDTTTQATVVDDLCAAIEPNLPPELGLADGQSGNDSRDDTEIATCTMESPDGTKLDIRVTSYALPEGDPDGELDRFAATACDGVQDQYADGFTEAPAGCSGQDAPGATEPTLTSATTVTTLPTLDAVASIVLTDRALPATVGAYTSAIAYSVVAASDELAG